MRVIEFNGVSYTCTLSPRFRRHTSDEQDAMRESLKANGVRVAVRIYRDTTLRFDNCLLDGEGRLSIAAELGLSSAKVPFYRESEMDTEAAYEQAKTLNDCRRHDDPEAIRQRRLERVAEKRAAGKSIRTIAAEEGVSKTQIERDIQVSRGGTPEVVTGRDGKEYPSAIPNEPEPVDNEADSEESNEEPEPLDDSLPQPAHDTSRKQPSWMKPGNNTDPDHPFAEILNSFTSLTAAITKAIRNEKGEQLLEAFREAQVGSHHLPLLYFTSDKFDGEEFKPQTVKFVGLYALRRLIRDVGNWKRKRTATQIRAAYTEALEAAKNGGSDL